MTTQITNLQYQILKTLDVSHALAMAGNVITGGVKDNGEHASREETALAGLHKARLVLGNVFTMEETTTSAEWLVAHGWRLPGNEATQRRQT